MTLTLKAEITVPKSVRRKAGFRPGDRVEFKVADRIITIVPKLAPDEEQDEREIRDPKVRATIRKSYQDFLAGREPAHRSPFWRTFCAEREASQVIVTHDSTAFRGSHYLPHDRLSNKLRKGNRDFSAAEKSAARVLSSNPYNRSRQHNIKKLEDVPSGDGQYRLALGRWRFRYDIVGQAVWLHYCGLRREDTY